MSRSRTLRPRFFLNDELGQLSPLHRLLFAGLWCEADREGRLLDRPVKLKAAILPYDACDVDQMLSDLAARGFITRYKVGKIASVQVIAFAKHQNPHPKEAPSQIEPPQQVNGREKIRPSSNLGMTLVNMPGIPSREKIRPSRVVLDLDLRSSLMDPVPSGSSAPDPHQPPVEVTVTAPPPARTPTPGNSTSQTLKTERPGQEHRTVGSLVRDLASGSKMENAVGPGENKRRLRELDRKRQNTAGPRRSDEEKAWEVVTLCMESDEPSKNTGNPQIIAAVASIGGWEYLGMAEDIAALKHQFLEAYKTAAALKEMPA